MRIISGTHKGKIITPDKNFKARPTTDFAKENLFNVLNNYIDIEDASVLDLFAGTGSISYEFASRGAGKIISIELNYNQLPLTSFSQTLLTIWKKSTRFRLPFSITIY